MALKSQIQTNAHVPNKKVCEWKFVSIVVSSLVWCQAWATKKSKWNETQSNSKKPTQSNYFNPISFCMFFPFFLCLFLSLFLHFPTADISQISHTNVHSLIWNWRSFLFCSRFCFSLLSLCYCYFSKRNICCFSKKIWTVRRGKHDLWYSRQLKTGMIPPSMNFGGPPKETEKTLKYTCRICDKNSKIFQSRHHYYVLCLKYYHLCCAFSIFVSFLPVCAAS